MRKTAIGIFNDNKLVQVLACELDREDTWEEVSETEFISTEIKGLKLDIGENKYIYTLNECNDYGICIIDLENESQLTEIVKVEDMYRLLSLNEITLLCSNMQINKNDSNDYELNIDKELITIHQTKLISIKNNKNILQFIM